MPTAFKYSNVHLCICIVLFLTGLAIAGCGATNHSSGGVTVRGSIAIESVEKNNLIESEIGLLRGRVVDSLFHELFGTYKVTVRGAARGADSIAKRFNSIDFEIYLPVGRYDIEVSRSTTREVLYLRDVNVRSQEVTTVRVVLGGTAI